MSKNEVIELHTPHDGRDSPDGEGIKTGVNADAVDMHRMGKTQEFKRNFRSFSVLGLSSVIMATWVALLGSASFSLINGGYAGTIWMYVGVWVRSRQPVKRVFHCLLSFTGLHHSGDAFVSRNGLDGAHQWWTISLDI